MERAFGLPAGVWTGSEEERSERGSAGSAERGYAGEGTGAGHGFRLRRFGAYSFERDVARIYETNVSFKVRLLELLRATKVHCYIHAGSSRNTVTGQTARLRTWHYCRTATIR